MQQIMFASLAAGGGGYVINGSGMFDGDSGFLSLTPSVGNRKTFTISCVIKRANVGTPQNIFSAGTHGGHTVQAYFHGNGHIQIADYVGSGVYNFQLDTIAAFRDPGAWYHIVVKYNSTAATPSSSDNGVFVNGVQLTDFSAEIYPDQNDESAWNTNTVHRLGRWTAAGQYFNGYAAQYVSVEGQALNADSFGEFTNDGFWQINDASGLTFGTNGFLLEGGTNVAAGTDSSGNSNNFAVTATITATNDSPTNGDAE
tara:strand:- start:380 stop:1147 length:768 start_codon:yes stop_codon:yes gene_type:complete